LLGLFLQVLDRHGVSEHYKVLSAATVGDFIRIHYLVVVDWFRGDNSIGIQTPIRDDATALAFLEAHACLTVPKVAPFELVAAHAASCDPSLADGLCCAGPGPGNGCFAGCFAVSSEPAPNGCDLINEVDIDVADASRECVLRQLACPDVLPTPVT